jgi:NUMOD4 motif/HNH endonuclease
MEEEIWRAAVGYEGFYEVSNLGRVKRVAPGTSARPGRIMQRRPAPDGDLTVQLFKGGRSYGTNVTKVVGEAFIGPCPDGFVFKQRDGDQANVGASNLCIVSRSESMQMAWAAGKLCVGECRRDAKLTDDKVREIRSLWPGVSQKAIGALFGVSQAVVWHIIHRKRWRHV